MSPSCRLLAVLPVIAGALFLLTPAAQGGTILVDLEDVSLSDPYIFGTGIQSRGFDLVHSGSFAYVMDNTFPGATRLSGNGTTRWLSFNISTLTFSESSGQVFDLLGFEGGETWTSEPHNWATSILVTGYPAAGGVVTESFTLDLVKDPVQGMQTFLPGLSFTDLTRLEFTGIGGNPEFSVDNILVQTRTIPEPASMALLGLGLAGLAAWRRRRHRGS